ncbi:MAG: putative dehydrogenase [Phycisphaerales bacterium]|jgi:predicted dehydrogenase
MTDYDRRDFMTKAAGGLAALAVLPELGLANLPSSKAGLRVGVIGAGRHGRAILGELAKVEGVQVVALCDPDERRLASGLRRTAGAEGFATVDAMLTGAADGAEIDAVIVATPTQTHREVAEACIAAGKHTYVETPLAHTAEDCAAIVAAARGASVVCAGGFQGRSNPVYKLARGFFKTDSVRDLVSIRAQHNNKESWRTPSNDPAREKRLNWKLDPEVSTGLAGEWGSQQFDVAHWYTGKYPTRVRGHGGIRLWKDGRTIADTIACDLIFEDGAVMQYGATLANSYEDTHELFFGTNAAIKLAWSHGWLFKESDAATQGWEVYANRVQFHKDEGITLIADATKLASQGKLQDGVGLSHSALYYALSDFVASIENSESPACSISEAARGTAVALAANQAVITGNDIEIDLSTL